MVNGAEENVLAAEPQFEKVCVKGNECQHEHKLIYRPVAAREVLDAMPENSPAIPVYEPGQ